MQEEFSKIPVIVIFAPTATGKTALTLKLFGKSGHSFFNGKAELISADSLQAYKDMNIGTAKPSKDELSELKTHLIDIHTFDEVYGVSEFVEKADFFLKCKSCPYSIIRFRESGCFSDKKYKITIR